MAVGLVAALVGLRANFTEVGLEDWAAGDRVVALPVAGRPEDAVVHRTRRAGKYTEVEFSAPPRQAWPAGTPVRREACGGCGGGSRFVAEPFVTECNACYWPGGCGPTAYPERSADVHRVDWLYHADAGDAAGLFSALDADRRFVHACEACSEWNRTAMTIRLRMAVVGCTPDFDAASPPDYPGFSPVASARPRRKVSADNGDDLAELAVVAALMLATAAMLLGLYWELARRSSAKV